MQIIKIEKTRFKKNTFKVTFDSDDNILLSADTIVKYSLKTGSVLTAKEYGQIMTFDKSNNISADALALISKRSYSSKKLQEKLIAKGYEAQSAKKAAERLKELKYIDDEKYAKMYAQYLANRSKGEFAIKSELEKQGIDGATLKKTLESLKNDMQPHEQIIKVIKSRLKNSTIKTKTK